MQSRRKAESKWTPYGHEKARRQALMQRHAWLAIAALAIAMFYGVFLSLTVTQQDSIDSGGQIEVRREDEKPMRVQVTPGGIPGFADSQADAPGGVDAPGLAEREEGPLMATLRPLLPVIAPLAGALWLLSRVGASARGRLAELNFGVYKGPMPYEMHTSKRLKQVFTHRQVEDHLFGKTREDFLAGTYLGDVPLSIRRMLGESPYEEAQVARLRKAGRSRRPQTVHHGPSGIGPTAVAASSRSPSGSGAVRRSPSRRGPVAARLEDAWHEEGVSGVYRSLKKELDRRRELHRRIRQAHRLRLARQQQAMRDGEAEGA
jgi:hypothetical protein